MSFFFFFSKCTFVLMKYNHFFMCVCVLGAGDCVVYRLPGADLLLLPGLSGGERIQQGLRHLRRRSVVGHGEHGYTCAHLQ